MNAREHNEEEYLDDEYTEDDVENYLVEDSEEEDDEDWGWKEESDNLDEEDEEEEYIYVDEDGNELADYDDDEYEIEYEEEEEEDEDYFLDSEHPLESDLSDFSVDNEQPTVNMETSAHSVHESLSTRADNDDSEYIDDSEEELEEKKKEKVDLKKKLGDVKEKINLEPFVNSYDDKVSSLVSFLAKIPLVGKIFASIGESKVATRAFPFTFIFLVVGILVAISFFTAPSKTSVVELPDMGELTVVSKEYNVDTDSMSVSIENTGDVVMSTPLTLSLYSYSPNLNPLSLASFEELGQCSIEDVVVDMGEEKEFILPCSFNKGKTAEDVKFRTVVSLKDVEDNDK